VKRTRERGGQRKTECSSLVLLLSFFCLSCERFFDLGEILEAVEREPASFLSACISPTDGA